MHLDLNHRRATEAFVSDSINAALDRARDAMRPIPRAYLGASSIGNECLRRIQLDWQEPQPVSAQTNRIFERGHWGEVFCRRELIRGGFVFASDPGPTMFEQAGGLFCGHADGRIESGPDIADMGYPCLWECKTIKASKWKELARNGVKSVYPQYYSQVQLYMAYLDLAEHPCLFTALCPDTMDLLHLLVPFDLTEAQRVSDRAVVVLAATEGGERLPQISDDPNFWQCKWCPHKRRCYG